MKDKKVYKQFLDFLITFLCNYGAIAAGISIFEKNPRAFIEAILAIIVAFIIIKMKKED